MSSLMAKLASFEALGENSCVVGPFESEEKRVNFAQAFFPALQALNDRLGLSNGSSGELPDPENSPTKIYATLEFVEREVYTLDFLRPGWTVNDWVSLLERTWKVRHPSLPIVLP